MSLGKLHRVVERRTGPKMAGSGVLVHRIQPSVGRFKHLNGNTGISAKLFCNHGCAKLKAAYAESIAPVCSYGVFNTQVLAKLIKARCGAK